MTAWLTFLLLLAPLLSTVLSTAADFAGRRVRLPAPDYNYKVHLNKQYSGWNQMEHMRASGEPSREAPAEGRQEILILIDSTAIHTGRGRLLRSTRSRRVHASHAGACPGTQGMGSHSELEQTAPTQAAADHTTPADHSSPRSHRPAARQSPRAPTLRTRQSQRADANERAGPEATPTTQSR